MATMTETRFDSLIITDMQKFLTNSRKLMYLSVSRPKVPQELKFEKNV